MRPTYAKTQVRRTSYLRDFYLHTMNHVFYLRFILLVQVEEMYITSTDVQKHKQETQAGKKVTQVGIPI